MGKGRNWTPMQVERLLNVIAEKLPLGGNLWEAVAEVYNRSRPKEIPERDVTALKRKFKVLKSSKKPTGAFMCYNNLIIL